MREYGFDPTDIKSFVLIVDGKAYTKSDAGIRVVGYFRWPWKVLAVLKLVPRPIRDWFYDFVARNRYHWFGKKASCMVPTASVRARFKLE